MPKKKRERRTSGALDRILRFDKEYVVRQVAYAVAIILVLVAVAILTKGSSCPASA